MNLIDSRCDESVWADLTRRVMDLYCSGDYVEAAPLAEAALRMAETAFGPNHPHTASSLVNLGALCRAVGRFDEALAHIDRAHCIDAHNLTTPDAA